MNKLKKVQQANPKEPMRGVAAGPIAHAGKVIFVSLWLSGCILDPAVSGVDQFPRYHEEENWRDVTVKPIALSTHQRLTLPTPEPDTLRAEEQETFSFRIENTPIKKALRQFAKAYQLNLVVDDDVNGVLDVEFYDVTLLEALFLMLDKLDYYWETENDVIRVRASESRQFSVDYLRLIRSGSGTSSATVSSSSPGGQGAGGNAGGGGDRGAGGDAGNGESGSIIIGHTDEIKFWSELELQINALLSEEGRVVVNRLSGTVQVKDQHSHVEQVADFLAHVKRSIHRQVDIEVQIMEVLLDDTNALGINWARVSEVLDSGTNIDFTLGGTVETPAGGVVPQTSVLRLDAFNLKNDGNTRIAAVVDALKQQGDVEIVSQPHVRTLNNQTSLIKVGTDRTFFRREQSVDSTSAGSITTATDVPQVVTEGVVLSITPQVGEAGWIMMDISPVVTRVSSISVVEGANGNIQSSAPNLDVAQVSSLVRAKSGETIVLGGLIQSQDSFTRRGLPGLGKLEPANRVLGGRYSSKVRRELIMILTPVIVPSES